MNRLFAFLIICWLSISSYASELVYHISFAPESHYIHVNLTLNDLKCEQTLLKMPVWAPGYYQIKDYPRNLADFAVTDTDGQPIQWEKQGKSGWLVRNGKQREVIVTYRIYAHKQDVCEAKVDPERAFMPGNGVFMYIDGEKENPITVHIQPAEGWEHISTGMEAVAGSPFTYRAKDADELYDCPFLIGNHLVVKKLWEGHEYEFAIETPDGIEETTFFDDIRKIVAEATKLMGEVPYSRYCFLLLGKGQGGLEHANSQASFTDGSFRFQSKSHYLRFLYFIAHEYFHLYNVKRIRPIELGPFDYDREVFTPMLWVSEGINMHFETELVRRAGLASDEEVLDKMSGFIRRVETKEGHKHMSLRQSSYDIWLNFLTDNENEDDVCINYYFKGPIVALLTDIEIRRLTDNRKSLDDVMRLLYYGYYKEKGRGFTEEEFWKVCREVAGSELTEMRRYVDTTTEIDYPRHLAPAGICIDEEYRLSTQKQ
ncbi:MAG: hypothetical protein ACI37U_03480 [Bacteroides sp.]